MQRVRFSQVKVRENGYYNTSMVPSIVIDVDSIIAFRVKENSYVCGIVETQILQVFFGSVDVLICFDSEGMEALMGDDIEDLRYKEEMT